MENYSTLNAQERNSVRSNQPEIPWLGSIVIKTFIVNLRNLTKNKLFICKEYHIQPSEIDRMQFWEYEWYTDEIKEISKEILDGNIELKPYNKNGVTPCEYCEYKAMCRYDILQSGYRAIDQKKDKYSFPQKKCKKKGF